mmetsp:Transcript_18428/g.47246  ORF Transcript_18428/g.47246 Transcript_18428/m.47246 type:complete len:523 (+) Transcript_18428:68-1636(+)
MGKSFEEYQKEKREREWKDKVKKKKESMGNQQRFDTATNYKGIGNDKFKAGNRSEAIEYYREAVEYVKDLTNAWKKDRDPLLLSLYCNLSLCYFREGDFPAAEEAANEAVKVPGESAKAHYLRGRARMKLDEWEKAKSDLQVALKLQPSNTEAQQALEEVKQACAEENRKAKEVFGGFMQRKKDASAKVDPAEEAAKQAAAEAAAAERAARAAAEKKAQEAAEKKALEEEKQRMAQAFDKLATKPGLYDDREKEMEPVREKLKQEDQRLDLERNLLNIIDESEGKPQCPDLDDYRVKREKMAWDQEDQLQAKKRILKKLDREKEWSEQDEWRATADQIKARKQDEQRQRPRSTDWEEKDVLKWCQQEIRSRLHRLSCQSPEKENVVAAVVDATKVDGEAIVWVRGERRIRWIELTLKLEWEVGVEGARYRSAQDQIKSAAAGSYDAPDFVLEDAVVWGSFRLPELSEDTRAECKGQWPVVTKQRKTTAAAVDVKSADAAVELLRQKVVLELESFFESLLSTF